MLMLNKIKQLRKARGLSQSDLGDQIGVHWQTISRIERQKTRLMAKQERALAEFFGVAPDDLYTKGDAPGVRSVHIQQHVQAGVYAESNLWPDDEGYDVVVPDDEELRGFSLYGAEARGSSMNLVYPAGTVLVYTSQLETAESLMVGKRYIVERERIDGLRESTVKTLWQDQEGFYWLQPESDDPRFTAIPVENLNGDRVRIVGRVRYSVRRE